MKKIQHGDGASPAKIAMAQLWSPTDERTVREATLDMEPKLMAGTRCPCCQSSVKVYWRRLSPEMARFLIWLLRNHEAGHEWVDVRAAPFRGGDYAKPRLWRFVERMIDVDGVDEPKPGRWRLTPLGERFVLGRARASRYAASFKGENVGFSVEDCDVRDVLASTNFSYEDLMGRR